MAHFVPSDALALWIGTAGTIPANWSRDTDYDDVYLQSVTNDDRGTGGSSHTHTSTHGHTGNTHTHTFSGDTQTPTSSLRSRDFFGTPTSGVAHGHNSATSNTATITYVNESAAVNAGSADPPFVRAIVIKPDDGSQLIPDGAFCFTAKAAAPTGFDITGSGGTVDYDGKFVKGAVAAGDGGGTGGTATHAHTKDNHTHSADSHLHAEKLCGLSNTLVRLVTAVTLKTHNRQHHNVELETTALSDVSTDAVVVDAASSEPSYYTLLGIENTSGSPALPDGVILMYEGTIASIPDQWSHYAALGARQLKITKTPAEIGETGGADSHVHNIQAHGHTHSGTHTHIGTDTHFDETTSKTGGLTIASLADDVTSKHSHTWTVGNTTPTMQNAAAFDTGSTDKREAYREVIFIEYAPYTVHVKGANIQGAVIAA